MRNILSFILLGLFVTGCATNQHTNMENTKFGKQKEDFVIIDSKVLEERIERKIELAFSSQKAFAEKIYKVRGNKENSVLADISFIQRQIEYRYNTYDVEDIKYYKCFIHEVTFDNVLPNIVSSPLSINQKVLSYIFDFSQDYQSKCARINYHLYTALENTRYN